MPKFKTEETESESRFAAPVGESEIRKLSVLSTSRDGGQCCGSFKMDLLCSDQFSLEDDFILSRIANMAEDDTDQIMCSQEQTLETQY